MAYKRICSLEQELKVLEYLDTVRAATAHGIAAQLKIPRPTVYRILETLEQYGLLYRSASDSVFRLTAAADRSDGALGRAYLAFCPEDERNENLAYLRRLDDPDNALSHDEAFVEGIFANSRATTGTAAVASCVIQNASALPYLFSIEAG